MTDEVLTRRELSMTAPTCATCRWWDVRMSSYSPYGPMSEGRCRKALPAIGWPTTQKGDWCGEHAPKGDR